jgi:hypothetical protein
MIQWRPPVTPQTAQADPRAELALQLQQAFDRRDPGAVCHLGNRALQMGLTRLADQACAAMVGLLLSHISRGEAEEALVLEGFVYGAFVKAVEDEAHYERLFARWREPMAGLGRRFRDDPLTGSGTRRGIGFVVLSGVMLGHTEVLFRLLENRDTDTPVRIYSLGPCQQKFLERAQALGVPVEEFAGDAGILQRLQRLRARLAAERVRTAVWVAAPTTAIFAFAMGMAPVQVMWTLRYHPVRLPEIDGYLTYGSWGEESRVFHGQRWTVCPVPLALDARVPKAQDVRSLRARFPGKVLLGTLAREEKISSAPFLECVAAILERNPDCDYLWTGRVMHQGIASFFERRGLASRCHFVGWVDTPVYAAILDVFLETFPLGCGITGYQAIGAGAPLLSFLDANTVFGMQYWSALMARAGSPTAVTRELLDEYPVACARNADEYVEMATRLVQDAAFREAWRSREARFYAEEMASIARYSRRFFAAIEDVCSRKAA